MKPALAKYRSWTPGLLTALVGVACVRLAGPYLAGPGRTGIEIVGYLLVPVGLGLIAREVHRHASMDGRNT